jgi:hypothetical protein
VNLTVAEVRHLPFAGALLNGDELLAHTDEWTGAGPGAVTYPARGSRLVLSTHAAHPACAAMVTRLLDEVARVAAAVPRVQSLRLGMLADSLRIVAGRSTATSGAGSDVLEHACAGIASRTALRVGIDRCDDAAVLAPSVAALVLVQLAVNAEAHEQASAVTLSARDGSFTVSWEGAPPRGMPATARRRADRERWGLGFARIAADSIGARLFPPSDVDGARVALLETGLGHLALPLALVREGTVHKATRAWDEETALLPGSPVPPGSRAARCVERALGSPAEIVRVDGWTARHHAGATWIAVPPDGVADRARDVLDGMVHERALWDATPEPGRSRIVALAAILAALLGGELPRVPGTAWNARVRELAAAYGLAMVVPRFDGVGAVDPRVALFLALEVGERLETDGDHLVLHVSPRHRDDALVRALLPPGATSLKLS